MIFVVNVMYKIAASATHLTNIAFCFMLLLVQLREHKQKLYIAYLTNWPNRIFDYKFRAVEAENP